MAQPVSKRAPPTRRCKIHYRRLRRESGQFPEGFTLASALKNALSARAKGAGGRKVGLHVVNRVAVVPANHEFRRLWNNYTVTEPDVVFGDVCLYLPGDLQALLQLAGDKSQASLEEMMEAWDIAEQKAPDGMEYIRGITYWAAIGDHFYQIQDMSLQVKAMEEYFTWLLRDQASTISKEHYVELQATFDRQQFGDEDISSIEIGGAVPATVHEGAPVDLPPKIEEVDIKETLGDWGAKTFSKAMKILEDLLGEVEASKIVKSIPADAALEVKVNIGYRAKRRRLSKQVMGNIATGLRNMPDGEIRIRGKNGDVKGEDARLSQDMNIRRHSDQSSLLDLDHALEQILEVHRRFLHDGRIDQ